MKVKKVFAFSVAEALMALLIVSVVAGIMSPMFTKRGNPSLDYASLMKKIEKIEKAIPPKGSIIFVDGDKCPDGWSRVKDLGGYYPRIAGKAGEKVGDELEQMVQRHKHVSPFMQAISSHGFLNSFRYGPYQNFHKYVGDEEGTFVKGDGDYPELEAAKLSVKSDGTQKKGATESDYNITTSSQYLLRGFSSSGADFNNWYTYTSDGMNRWETLSVAGPRIESFPICPNRSISGSEMETDCQTSYSYIARANEISRQITVNAPPYLTNMAIVGEENRPNSVVWLACKRD